MPQTITVVDKRRHGLKVMQVLQLGEHKPDYSPVKITEVLHTGTFLETEKASALSEPDAFCGDNDRGNGCNGWFRICESEPHPVARA